MMSDSVACIALFEGKILIAHRNPTGQMGGRWEFPGGKIDGDENCERAIVREMREEFGVNAEVGEKICDGEFFHNGKKCALHAYEIFLEHDGIARPFALSEHTEYKWIPIGEIPADNFVDSDLGIYEKVKDFVEKKYGA
ncbi:MAG: NUDIX domain-containing protein [Treponemataceae bacterium]|nr:NUDIX domain-containing protein [Treponemataceae bacterium]